MEYGLKSLLKQKVGPMPHPINQNSPELRLFRLICAGEYESALSLFGKRKLFGGECVVDTPYKRFTGIDEINEFARGFLGVFNAVSANVIPVIQTRGGGRSVTEMIIEFNTGSVINQVAFFSVGDLKTQDTLDELRLYCFFKCVPGLTAYRKPMFFSAHKEAGDPNLLTGAVKEYYWGLHHSPCVDVERVLNCCNADCRFGGYRPDEDSENPDPNHLRKSYERMAGYIPRWIGMRYESIIDDGVNCVIEWQHVVSDDGRREAGRVAIGGISSYERGENGLLSSIRICDYAGFEKTINWDETPISKEEAYKINAVSVFPASVGDLKL